MQSAMPPVQTLNTNSHAWRQVRLWVWPEDQDILTIETKLREKEESLEVPLEESVSIPGEIPALIDTSQTTQVIQSSIFLQLYLGKNCSRNNIKSCLKVLYFHSLWKYTWLKSLLVMVSGPADTTPGPQPHRNSRDVSLPVCVCVCYFLI